MPNTILTQTTDYDAIRGYLGVDDLALSDDTVANFTFIGIAEIVITKLIASQASNGVASVSAILTDPNSADYTLLKNAVAAYVAYLFTHGSTNAVNTSVTDGAQTIDLGGIGTQWIEQGEKALQQCAYYLSLLDNWVETSINTLSVAGPSRSSNYNSISGFLRGAWLN